LAQNGIALYTAIQVVPVRENTGHISLCCCMVYRIFWVYQYLSCHGVQTGSGVHPATYPVVTEDSFPGDEAAGAWSWPLISISFRG